MFIMEPQYLKVIYYKMKGVLITETKIKLECTFCSQFSLLFLISWNTGTYEPLRSYFLIKNVL